jgi:DnaJ-class molecular chaperone
MEYLYDKKEFCQFCNGRGERLSEDGDYKDCPECLGTGMKQEELENPE